MAQGQLAPALQVVRTEQPQSRVPQFETCGRAPSRIALPQTLRGSLGGRGIACAAQSEQRPVVTRDASIEPLGFEVLEQLQRARDLAQGAQAREHSLKALGGRPAHLGIGMTQPQHQRRALRSGRTTFGRVRQVEPVRRQDCGEDVRGRSRSHIGCESVGHERSDDRSGSRGLGKRLGGHAALPVDHFARQPAQGLARRGDVEAAERSQRHLANPRLVVVACDVLERGDAQVQGGRAQVAARADLEQFQSHGCGWVVEQREDLGHLRGGRLGRQELPARDAFDARSIAEPGEAGLEHAVPALCQNVPCGARAPGILRTQVLHERGGVVLVKHHRGLHEWCGRQPENQQEQGTHQEGSSSTASAWAAASSRRRLR